jgi:hypothetical protein
VHKPLVLALAAAFAPPPEATRDLAAARSPRRRERRCGEPRYRDRREVERRLHRRLGNPASVADESVANVLAVPSYQRFARVVARGNSARPTLRAFRAAVAQLAQQDARLTRLRLDFCSFVGDWRRAGWPRSYFELTHDRSDRLATTAELVL